MRAPAVVAALSLCACLEVPPASCPPGGDADEDGWPCGGVAPDCDDGDPDINPGVADDCATIFAEDCGGEPLACPLPSGLVSGTSPGDATWGVHGGGISTTFQASLQWVLASLVPEGDTELLSQVPTEDEQYVGVTVYPRFDQWEVDAAMPTALDTGPAYVRIAVEWSSNIPDAAGEGVSTFGFFPDGLIHRHERFDTPGSALTFAFLSSHWSLNATRFTNLDVLEGDQVLSGKPTGADALHLHTAGTDAGVACAYHADDGRRVTMAWRDTPAAAGSRVIYGRQTPAPHRLSLNYDWLRSSDGIPPGVYESVTALVVDEIDEGGSPCATAGALADVLRDPPTLAFAAGMAGEHADATGYVAEEGLYEVEAATGEPYVEVTTIGAAVRGLMIRVVIDAPDGVTVWRGGERLRAVRDYFVQPTDDGVTVYVPGRVDDDETLRIAAPGGEPTS